MADVSGSAPEEGKKHFVQKPEKPDQELFEKNLKQAQDEHAAVRDKLVSSFFSLALLLIELGGQF